MTLKQMYEAIDKLDSSNLLSAVFVYAFALKIGKHAISNRYASAINFNSVFEAISLQV